MRREPAAVMSRALDLRRAFDQTFAEPPRTVVEGALNLLGIRVGGDAYAVRLGEIAGLFVERRIVPLPSPMADLLGLAGLRGGVVPVYSLRGLLGYSTAGDAGRWLILAGSGHAVGLAFEEFEGYLRIPTSGLLPSRGETRRPHVPEAARAAEALRGVISIHSIVEAIKERTRVTGTIKEQ